MNKFFFGLALGCLLPVMSSSAWAGFQEGADAYGKGDYQAALNEWLPMAQAGDAQAENAVGALYDNGLGVTSDAAEAFRWYSMAASQNYPLAMRNLGTMYATGHGVPYNLQQAQLWLGKAAGAGDRVAGDRLAALPPVGSTPADPVVTPLAATSSAVGTDSAAPGTASNFGAVTGPSSLQTQPSQSANSQATARDANTQGANTQGTNTQAAATASSNDQATASQQTADASAAAPAAPAADDSGQATAATALTFPAPKPAETADSSQASTSQAAGTASSAAPATQVATAAPDSSQATTTGTATTGASDATPGTVADGWHAFDVGDYKTALMIWQPLAQNGDSNLQVLVGSLYDYGQGVPQDKKQALQWYLLAAQKGSGRGQYAAGALLIKDAKQRNLVEAYKWLTIANGTLKGEGGDIAANQAMSLRQQISKEMSQDDIAKAETLAQGFHAG